MYFVCLFGKINIKDGKIKHFPIDCLWGFKLYCYFLIQTYFVTWWNWISLYFLEYFIYFGKLYRTKIISGLINKDQNLLLIAPSQLHQWEVLSSFLWLAEQTVHSELWAVIKYNVFPPSLYPSLCLSFPRDDPETDKCYYSVIRDSPLSLSFHPFLPPAFLSRASIVYVLKLTLITHNPSHPSPPSKWRVGCVETSAV